jgi:protein TonB
MRRDILLGMILAAVLHFSAALYSHITRHPAQPRGQVVKEEPLSYLVLPPETIEPPDIDADLPPPVGQPPPRGAETFQFATKEDFVIPPDLLPPVHGLTDLRFIPVATATTAIDRTVFMIKDVDTIPKAVLQVAPVYPPAMKSQGREGLAVIRFVVDADGGIRDLGVVSSSERVFATAALDAVAKWKFKAGRKGGRAVAVQMEVPINFHLAK